MGTLLLGILIGLFIGSTLGFMVAGLMHASSNTDRQRERENMDK